MSAAAAKGAWQTDHPGLTECARHGGMCAYRTGDPERCDICHADWDSIERRWLDAQPREDHLAAHQRAEVVAERDRQRLRAAKAS